LKQAKNRIGFDRCLAGMAAIAVVSGCAGPIESRAGIAGPAVSPAISLAVTATAGQGGPGMAQAVAAVRQELVRQGFRLADDAALRVEVGLAEREATSALLAADGSVLSPIKKKRLLQDCADRRHRLTIAVIPPKGPPRRAWAEENHCHGTVAESIQPLAVRAVAMLNDDPSTAVRYRKGRD